MSLLQSFCKGICVVGALFVITGIILLYAPSDLSEIQSFTWPTIGVGAALIIGATVLWQIRKPYAS